MKVETVIILQKSNDSSYKLNICGPTRSINADPAHKEIAEDLNLLTYFMCGVCLKHFSKKIQDIFFEILFASNLCCSVKMW